MVKEKTISRYTFDEKKHMHTLDGKPLMGVTTVLGVINKPMLIQWSANMAVDFIESHKTDAHFNMSTGIGSISFDMGFDELLKEARVAHRKKKEAAGDLGTELHAKIELVILRAIQENNGFITEEMQVDGTHLFVAWAITNNVKFLASEKNIYSEEWWVGGITDIICEIDGKRFIGDVKTSSGIYPEHYIQASAYSKMAVEMGLYEKFDGVVIINCKKDGGFDVQYNLDIEGNVKCFEAALTLYKHLKAIDK
jgi:hypothetical protein